MQKKNIFLLVIFLIILTALSWWATTRDSGQLNPSPADQNSLHQATLIIDRGEDSPINLPVDFNQGASALDVLGAKATELALPLETKEYDFGILIETIGDKTNGDDNKYWTYFVNHEMPMVSADAYELSPGDRLEFKFDESPF